MAGSDDDNNDTITITLAQFENVKTLKKGMLDVCLFIIRWHSLKCFHATTLT
jgi:hypothetical protein